MDEELMQGWPIASQLVLAELQQLLLTYSEASSEISSIEAKLSRVLEECENVKSKLESRKDEIRKLSGMYVEALVEKQMILNKMVLKNREGAWN